MQSRASLCYNAPLSRDNKYVEKARPEVHLRSRNKIKFKIYKRVHEMYLKSPISRGTLMWDWIPESIQRSTTKVKFKGFEAIHGGSDYALTEIMVDVRDWNTGILVGVRLSYS